jgi:pilus assembly protein CpaF
MIPEQFFIESIRSLLAPVSAFLDDETVTEIMINGPSSVFLERGGRLERLPVKFESNDALLAALRAIAQYAGQPLDELHPILQARLPNGSRVQAVIPPASFEGVTISIRRFSKAMFSLDRLIALGALTPDAAVTLKAMASAKLNVMVAGGTGSGKTSMLNTLSAAIPEEERILVIEDVKELQLQQEHVVYLEARPPDTKGRGQVTIRDLFRACLRMRPDRIVIGEIRGGEALDIIQAMVSGHGGCLGTLHATYPRDTLTRLETMAMMSDVELPLAALRAQIASGVNILIQVARLPDGSRKVTHISEVCGYDPASMKYEIQDIFLRKLVARGPNGELVHALLPTGLLPICAPQLQAHGVDLPDAVHDAARRRAANGHSFAGADAHV